MVEIDFSCEEIPVKKVLQCSLGLRSKELQILRGVEKPRTAQEVAELYGVSKNYAQRMLKNLTDKELVTRRSYNLRSGGYVYEYQRKSEDEIIEVVLGNLKEWHDRAQETVKEEGL